LERIQEILASVHLITNPDQAYFVFDRRYYGSGSGYKMPKNIIQMLQIQNIDIGFTPDPRHFDADLFALMRIQIPAYYFIADPDTASQMMRIHANPDPQALIMRYLMSIRTFYLP
jgi:hypothetical protein